MSHGRYTGTFFNVYSFYLLAWTISAVRVLYRISCLKYGKMFDLNKEQFYLRS